MRERVYDVTQTIVRERIVRVTAKSQAEAEALAERGYGSIVKRQGAGHLLCSVAKIARDGGGT